MKQKGEPIMADRILILVGDDYEDLELQVPRYRLLEAGYDVVLGGLEVAGTLYRGKHGYPQKSTHALNDLTAEMFVGAVIPGGWMPDKLRRFDVVKKLVKQLDQQRKPIASICHGPWIDISAGIVKGVKYTSTPAIKDDLTNAGAIWQDAEVVVDGNRVSSRRPDDLPAFCRAFLAMLAG